MDIIKIAHRYANAGFSPIPLVPNSKRPALKGWQKHAEDPITDFSVFEKTNGIGLVMGFDGIQCLDIDAKHFDGDEYAEFCELINEAAPDLMSKMIIQETQSGGFHWIFKCDEIAGNEKLAKNKASEVTFETRGRGGQIVVWPTKGYKIQGKITNVTKISPEERNVIWSCARMMDAAPIPPDPIELQPIAKGPSNDPDESTPWGEFRATHHVIEVLTLSGWSGVRETDPMTYMLRPNNPTSETSGVVFNDSGLFYPFTTSTEFEAEKAYDAFQAYVVLEHGGDFKSAITQLKNDGYGKEPEPKAISDEALFDYETATSDEIDEMLALLRSLEVDSTQEISEPEKAISLKFGADHYIFGTMGNFSLIQGKAKSRKSYFLSMLMGAAVSDFDVCGHVRGHVRDRLNIYIDTEQGDWHASKAKHRIQTIGGLDPRKNYDQFKHYRFRGLLTNKERMKLTDYIMKTHDNLGLVVIDGIVDLASKGVNDEEEATAIASKLLEWTEKKSCHISVVLHENKNDRNAKGHLGSLLVQKAETTISLQKSADVVGASEIVPEYTRNMEFPPMLMKVQGFDEIELTLNEPEDPIAERVWTSDDYHRLLDQISGKSKTDAAKFIRDIEGVTKRMAEKVINEMEVNGMIEFKKVGRSTLIMKNGII